MTFMVKARPWFIAIWTIFAILWLAQGVLYLQQHESKPWPYISVAVGVLTCIGGIPIPPLIPPPKITDPKPTPHCHAHTPPFFILSHPPLSS